MEHEGCYFEDGERRADYVIVTENIKLQLLQIFLQEMDNNGLDYEIAEGKKVFKLFILIHLRPSTFSYYSTHYDVGLEETRHYIKTHIRLFGITSDTPVSDIPERKKGELFSHDRIIIIHKILRSIGLLRLLEEKIIETAYPLHDGYYKISPATTKLNDRQLLMEYWSKPSVFYKEAPLDLIRKYFGTEVAFYFAWLEYFNIMLLPMSILGVIITVVNSIISNFWYIHEIEKVCEGKKIFVCPTCETPGLCVFKPLSLHCDRARKSYLFDNRLTVAYAICMSIWATIFLHYWKRRQAELALKWDAKFDDTGETRPQYMKRATKKRKNIITGEEEMCVPQLERVARVGVSVALCLLLAAITFFRVVVFTLVKMSIHTQLRKWNMEARYAKPLNMCIGSMITVILIRLIGYVFYGKMVTKLTNIENPRTPADYNKSVLYKKFFLAFINNYSTLLYMAFMKGKFFTYPEEEPLTFFIKFKRHTCQPLNCIVDVGVLLAFILFFKRLVGNVLVLIWPHINILVRRILGRKHVNEGLPQYEREYFLEPIGKYALMREFSDMIIEFGFVTFFVAAFPLAPVLALINNLLEHRFDAYKFVRRYRRPVPRRVSGIGPWNGILLGMTYLSTVTNAFIVAFTSDFVTKEVYRYTHNHNMTQYLNSTLAEFFTKDKPTFANMNPPSEVCVYRAWRYPYYDKKKYQQDGRYWQYITWKSIAVVIFEHVIFGLNAILVRTIPSTPKRVKEHFILDAKLAKEAQLKISEEDKEILEKIGLRSRHIFTISSTETV